MCTAFEWEYKVMSMDEFHCTLHVFVVDFPYKKDTISAVTHTVGAYGTIHNT
jgi:hypothetical protein